MTSSVTRDVTGRDAIYSYDFNELTTEMTSRVT